MEFILKDHKTHNNSLCYFGHSTTSTKATLDDIRLIYFNDIYVENIYINTDNNINMYKYSL